MPTIVDVRSLELTRGLPLMSVKLVVSVLQRLAPGGPASPPPPGSRAEVVPAAGLASRHGD